MYSNTSTMRSAALLAIVYYGLGQTSIYAAIAINQITDINGSPTGVGFDGAVNLFASGSGAPFQVDDDAVFMNNDIVVYTMNGISANDGAGLSISISNGENGITQTNPPGPPGSPAGSPNTDVDNAEPVDPVFAAIGNASGKLENGNAIRFSMWMRQDPNDPVTKVPQIEPVLKLELWKEARSAFADFEPPDFPRFGDRLWDTDQNAGNPTFNGQDQSQASWVDMDNNGATSFGKPVAASLVTDEWRRVEAFLVVDDDPLDDGFQWTIGTQVNFDVSDVEEIRAVMFLGDFIQNNNLTDAGSIWVDNLMLEVFANEAAMLATPNPNSAPVESEGLPGDYNGDGSVDAADYVVWRKNPGAFGGDPGGYNTWRMNFDVPDGAGSGLGASAVPEPTALVFAFSCLVMCAVACRR
ncbi:MAG TPA: hypothetical protein VJ809_16130 [Pirellulales bacterium]|nr:hypothetical protein [Pirellulales bacterium]